MPSNHLIFEVLPDSKRAMATVTVVGGNAASQAAYSTPSVSPAA
jgi:hypothetical protein